MNFGGGLLGRVHCGDSADIADALQNQNQPTILTTIVSTKVELNPQQPPSMRRLATPPGTPRDASTPHSRWSLPTTPSSMPSLA
jgi:hypothetical protein